MKLISLVLITLSIFMLLSLVLNINILFIFLIFIASTFFSFICFLNFESFPNYDRKKFVNKQGIGFIKDKFGAKKVPRVIDPTITGFFEVDQILQNIIQLLMRDYVFTWYNRTSPDQDFPDLLRLAFEETISTFSQYAQQMNWVDFFSLTLVDELASHFRIYKKAKEFLQNGDGTQKLEGVFFDFEAKMKGMSRERICLSPEVEKEYLECLCELIMFELFPSSIFECVAVRYLLRTILVERVLSPLITSLCEPDYVNQLLNYQLSNFNINKDIFVNIVKTAIHSDEADALIALVDGEIDKCGSKDTGGSGVAEIKQTLSSLKYLKYICTTRLKFLTDNFNMSDDTLDFTQLKQYLEDPSLYNMKFEEMIDSCIATSHFSNYLSEVKMNHYLWFYTHCMSFIQSVRQSNASLDFRDGDDTVRTKITQNVCKMGREIYDKYLSAETITHVNLHDDVLLEIKNQLNSGEINESLFTLACEIVYEHMRKHYFDSFKKSMHYAAALLDMGFITLSTDDSVQGVCSVTKLSEGDDNFADFENEQLITVCGCIYGSETVVEGLMTHRVYKLDCNETFHSTGEIKSRDGISRRYVHFAKFNKILREMVDVSFLPDLPAKKMIMTTQEDYRDMEIKLNIYLKSLSNSSFQRAERRVYYLLNEFLQLSPWSVCETEIKRKFPKITKKTLFSSLFDGILKPEITSHEDSSRQNDFVINSDRDSIVDNLAYKFEQDVDNIPLRIILMFADELFDLKTENRWLRRRMVALLSEVIRATYGDTINKRIVDHIKWLVNREQIVVYLKTFRDSLWPNGVMAESSPQRDRGTKMRTRVVTRCKLLSAIPDEVRTFIGQHTVQKGVTHVFNMFQIPILNRRLAYVLIERFVECLFQNTQIMNSLYNFHSKN